MKTKNPLRIFAPIVALLLIGMGCNSSDTTVVRSGDKLISFYEVPLVCGADTNIGCGSRIKPLFIAIGGENKILEAWSNRKGTVIAIVWDSTMTDADAREQIIMPLFEKNSIEAATIADAAKNNQLAESMSKDQWYKGMEVDQLSIEEAGYIAEQQVTFAMNTDLITQVEGDSIKVAIEEYFKIELVKVRTLSELVSEETREGWMDDCVALATKYVGEERAQKMLEIYQEQCAKESCKEESCCDEDKESCSDKK